MGRVARVVVPGTPHHVTQRGNRRAQVFEAGEDYETYLRMLKKYATQHGLAVWAYCLMPNHIHIVAVPEREKSLAAALRDAHTAYALYFNARTSQIGHVWQGRFYSTPMDDEHLWTAVRYVEQNPIRAKLVDVAASYPWSSAAAHCGFRTDPLLARGFPPPGIIEDWETWLAMEEPAAQTERIRRNTNTGRPCGSDDFVAHLERQLGRRLRPQKRGRKTREQNGD